MSASAQDSANGLSVFISYAQADADWYGKLKTHLAALERQGKIACWSREMIRGGKEPASLIDEHLETAQIILLLITPDFIASDQCYSVEMSRAVERYKAGEVRLIPILLSPIVNWKHMPFGALQPLPANGKPIIGWQNKDLALFEVVNDISKVVEELFDRQYHPRVSYRNLISPPPPTHPDATLPRRALVQEVYSRIIRPGSGSIALIGMGGTGKSTLAALLCDYAEEQRKMGNGPFSGRTLWLTVHAAATITDLIGTLREELGQLPLSFKNLTARNMAMELFKTLNTAAQPCLIILDQFEELLDPQTGKALTEQPGIGEWLDMLNSRPCASRVLLTSRFAPQGTRPYPPVYLQTHCVDALTEDEGVALLRMWGVQAKEAELRLAVERCQGHAQALLLLSGLLKLNPSVRIATLFNDSRYVHQRTNTMAELLNYIFTHQLNQDQRDLLRAFSVYREAVPLEAAQAIVEQHSPLTIEKLMAALDILLAQHLLQAVGDLRYHLHSLVAEFARNHFAEGAQANQQALRNAHAEAAQYYRSLAALTALPRKERRRVDDVRDFIEALYHHCRAGQQQDAYSLILQEGIFFDLQRWGGNSILLELYLYLLPSDTTWQPAPMQAARIYNEIGEIYQVLGRERDAQRAYKLALQGYRQLEDRGGIVNVLDNLGSVYRRHGQIEEALACYEEARLIGDAAEESITGRGTTFNNLGYAYYTLGKQSKSKELAGQRYQQALQYYQQALPLHRTDGYHSEEARTLNNLGQVYHALKRKAEARDYHQRALELAQEIGHRRIEADALNDLGIIYREQGDKEIALEYYGLALRIFREISARSEEASVLNNLGYLSLFNKQYDATLACFVLARDIYIELQGSVQSEIPKSIMTELRLTLGEEQLKALLEEVEQHAEQIVEQVLQG